MRVLIDNCVPRKFARLISGHDVALAREMGWHELENGKLIAAAEAAGFDAMVTTDKNLQHQQDLSRRKLCVIVLSPRLVFFESLAPLLGQLDGVLDNLPQGALIILKPNEG